MNVVHYTEQPKTRDRIIEYMRDYQSRYHRPPAVREIAAAVDIASTSTIHAHLVRLEQDGVVKKIAGAENSTRCYTLVDGVKRCCPNCGFEL